MSHLHDEFPATNIYFTEGSVYGVTGARSIVYYFRNWAQSYNAWVTMLDEEGQPNAGPFTADATMVQLNSSDGSVTYRYEYFMCAFCCIICLSSRRFVTFCACTANFPNSFARGPSECFRNSTGRRQLRAATSITWRS